MELSYLQTQIIRAELKKMGITSEPIASELHDHLCCLIEENTDADCRFEEALKAAFNILDQEEMRDIQLKSKAIRNRKFAIMKMITMAGASMAASFCLFTLFAQAQEIPSALPLGTSEYRVTSEFGPRFNPIVKNKDRHNGIDLVADKNASILASASGVVVQAGVDEEFKNYGIRVVIDHGDGYETIYAHLSKTTVEAGDKLKKGDVIGIIGNTGASTATHLHYEVKKDNKYLDPKEFIAEVK